MTTFFQSLSWALFQSLVQGMVVYVALSLMLWAIPASRSRLRYSLSLLAMVALSFLFVFIWWKEFNVLTAFAGAPIVTISITSLSISQLSSGVALLPAIVGTRLFSLLGAAYILGVLLMVARLLIGVSHVVTLRKSGTKPAGDAADMMFRALTAKLRVTQNVRLLISARAQVPMVVGILKPVVLLPVATVANLNSFQLEAILLHELAHVRRYDYIANIVQAVMETLLFFNPFVWLLSSRLRDERERCCDDIVVRIIDEPVDYIAALTAVANHSRGGNSFALAATGQPGKLLARVQRIMEVQDFRLNYSRVIASILLLLTMVGSAAWISPVFQHKAGKVAAKVQKSETRQPVADIGSPKDMKTQAPPALADENVLVDRLLKDHVIDQVKGFLVERHYRVLYINRQALPDDVSSKYLDGLHKNLIRVQIFPLEERLRMHPDADLIQLLLPYTFESPCVEKPTAKEGC